MAKRSNEKDYYEVLQVHSKAEQEVIDAAYRKLAQKYHPDVSKDPDAAQRMKEINAAYEVLGNPNRRMEYDKRLEAKRVFKAAAEYKKEQEARTRKIIEELLVRYQSVSQRGRLSKLESDFASLDGTAIIRAQDGQFLGLISSDAYEPNSITSRYGSYGSEYSHTSIFNDYGNYGGTYSLQSPFNSSATMPPVIIQNSKAIAYLTTNPNLKPSINPHLLIEYFRPH